VPNEPSAEQCGRFPEGGIHQTYQQSWKRKETTSKSRTAAAGGALYVMQFKANDKRRNFKVGNEN
jgi:hypothetical protein